MIVDGFRSAFDMCQKLGIGFTKISSLFGHDAKPFGTVTPKPIKQLDRRRLIWNVFPVDTGPRRGKYPTASSTVVNGYGIAIEFATVTTRSDGRLIRASAAPSS